MLKYKYGGLLSFLMEDKNKVLDFSSFEEDDIVEILASCKAVEISEAVDVVKIPWGKFSCNLESVYNILDKFSGLDINFEPKNLGSKQLWKKIKSFDENNDDTQMNLVLKGKTSSPQRVHLRYFA